MEKKPLEGDGRSLIIRRQDNPLESVAEQIENIYMEAFPPAQRVDFESLTSAIKEGGRRMFTAEAGGEVVGFAMTTPLPETGIQCLEYLAVNSEQRGRGTGSILLRTLLGDLAATEHVPGLVLEVESDQEGSEAERETRRARIAFYRRNGAHLVEEVPRFLAPNLTDGGTLAMKLMWLPAGSDSPPLCGPELLACMRGIYTECYGLQPDDPRIEATLRSVTC